MGMDGALMLNIEMFDGNINVPDHNIMYCRLRVSEQVIVNVNITDGESMFVGTFGFRYLCAFVWVLPFVIMILLDVNLWYHYVCDYINAQIMHSIRLDGYSIFYPINEFGMVGIVQTQV